jgi:hypothetical protein
MPPPGYAQHSASGGSPGQRPEFFFLGGFCYFERILVFLVDL